MSLLMAACCCCDDIYGTIGDALKGDVQYRYQNNVQYIPTDNRPASWLTLSSTAVLALGETDTLGELTLGRYVGGVWDDYDLTHANLAAEARYRTRVPLTFDTSGLAGLTVRRAFVYVHDPGLAVTTAPSLSEHFNFALYDASDVQQDGLRNTATTDLPGWFRFAVTDPDTTINKTGNTVFQLRFESDPTAALPAAYTFPAYIIGDYVPPPGGLSVTRLSYCQAWLMASGSTPDVFLRVCLSAVFDHGDLT